MSMLTLERRWTRAENTVLRGVLQVGRAIGSRRRHHAAALALSGMDDHLLKDIGVSRLELDFGASRCRRPADT